MMRLDTLLEKREAILKYLQRLTQDHHNVLFADVGDYPGPPVSRVRKDIQVCLEDLCRLNSLLLERNGGINRELRSLEKYGDRLEKLKQREKELNEDREAWGRVQATPLKSEATARLKATSEYQKYLGEYIENVGVSNTSLNGEEETCLLSREDAVTNIALLKKAQQTVNYEVSQLELLLNNLKKDQKFINGELARVESQIRAQTHAVDAELDSVEKAKAVVLRKLGLLKEQQRDQGIFAVAGPIKPSEEELARALAQVDVFVSARRASLREMLSIHKEKKRELDQQLDSWREIVQHLETLEDGLRSRLASDPKLAPEEVRSLIANTITVIHDVNYHNSSSYVLECIRDELEALEIAERQLSREERRIPERSMPTVDKPGFLIMGVSPPKVGITRNILPKSPAEDPAKKV